jgi:RimJ/RimL family protein N-acetyltransferase
MRFERTNDMEAVRRIVTTPEIYRWLVDDNCPAAEDFRPEQSAAVFYVLTYDGPELLGLFGFIPQHRSVELHTSLLPTAWGPRAKQAIREVIAWIWDNTECDRILGPVPTDNRLALRFARASGMRKSFVKERSFLRGGKLYDQIVFEISRPGVPEPCLS